MQRGEVVLHDPRRPLESATRFGPPPGTLRKSRTPGDSRRAVYRAHLSEKPAKAPKTGPKPIPFQNACSLDPESMSQPETPVAPGPVGHQVSDEVREALKTSLRGC